MNGTNCGGSAAGSVTGAPWTDRQHFRYYAIVRAWMEDCGPGESLLDVGGFDTPVVTWGAFARRYSCDLHPGPVWPNVIAHVGDFLAWDVPERMTLITCCQVLEHLADDVVHRFAAKLRASADLLIVSVPYLWPAGRERGHRQDPISEATMRRIMGGAPDRSTIVRDNRRERLVGMWRNPV